MLRRNIRLRKEYLYRKSLEQKEQSIHDRKRRIREALQDGRQIPTELREDEAKWRDRELPMDDAKSSANAPLNHYDDEYARAGIEDPKILITTSREPSTRLQQFVKEMNLMFPNAQRVNRGSYETSDLMDLSRRYGVTDVIVFHEHRGEPNGMVVSHLPFGPTAYFNLSSVVLRHDIDKEIRGTVSEAFPHLIFHQFNTTLGQRVQNILRFLFPVPKSADSKRIITFANETDRISFRHHVYDQPLDEAGKKQLKLKEVGPRFEMKIYQIKLGTMEMKEAENEWVLRPYMNSKKPKLYVEESSLANAEHDDDNNDASEKRPAKRSRK